MQPVLADGIEPELLPNGFAFGNYVVQGCIGRGAMASVYRAEHTLLKKPVALKVMDRELVANTDARQRFLREGQAAAAIKHPNVVDITDVGLLDGRPYLVMELLEGEDLEHFLEHHERLSEAEVVELALPIVAALSVAHSCGVVHRDLKPGNIFLSQGADGELVPKILDFGVSKFSRFMMEGNPSSTPFDQLMGSPLYLPPEALHGARELTARSDQYSLGVVLYECITGQPPFLRDALLPLLNAISAGEFEPPSRLRPEISQELEQAIARAMSPDPAQRFGNIRDLGRALLAIAGMRTRLRWGRAFGQADASLVLAGETAPPIALRTVSPSEPAPDFKQPKRARQRVAIAVAVLLGNVGLWYLVRREPPPEAARSAAQGALQPMLGVGTQPGEHAAPTAAASGAEQTAANEPATKAPDSASRSRSPGRAAASSESARSAAKGKRVAAAAQRGMRRDAPELAGASDNSEPATAAPMLAPDDDDEVRDMFFPAARKPAEAARPAQASTPGVANEAPILD